MTSHSSTSNADAVKQSTVLQSQDYNYPSSVMTADLEKAEAPKNQVIPDHDAQYPEFLRRVVVVLIALYIAIFLTSLDRTILATAVPQITDAFHSLTDIGWYSSAYQIVACALQPLFGRFYTFCPAKWVFLASMLIFFVASLLCALAPSSPVFILGRAVAGLGLAGIVSGVIMLTVTLLPLQKRPAYQGFTAAMVVLASVIGPLIGGAFTSSESLTWRWCFWINLPIGGAAMVASIILIPYTKPAAASSSSPANETEDSNTTPTNLTLLQKLNRLDPLGTLLLLAAVVCLLLALQWGGTTYAWSSGRIIALLVLAGVLLLFFAAEQAWKQDAGTVPPRILAYRGVTASAVFAFCTMGSITLVTYYLPNWFQAVQGVSALESSIRNLPFVLAFLVGAVLAGPLVRKVGYYTPFLIAAACIMAVGAGLITSFGVGASEGQWIGYQVIYGIGCGLGQQQAGLAAQTLLPEKDVPTGIAIKFFGQMLGGAVFASVGQSVLTNELAKGLEAIQGLNLDAAAIESLGATELRQLVAPENLDAVLLAYNNALDKVFQVGMILACVALPAALLTEWKSIKGRKIGKGM